MTMALPRHFLLGQFWIEQQLVLEMLAALVDRVNVPTSTAADMRFGHGFQAQSDNVGLQPAKASEADCAGPVEVQTAIRPLSDVHQFRDSKEGKNGPTCFRCRGQVVVSEQIDEEFGCQWFLPWRPRI